MTAADETRPVVRDLEIIGEPASTQIVELAKYWRSRCHGGPMPRRADIDPVQIPAHLPHIFMLDVLPNGDYRYRLMGTALVEGTGRDVTGRLLSDVHGGRPHVFRQLKALFDQVAQFKHPVYSRGLVFWLKNDDFRRFEGGYFPLSEDGEHVSIILAELFLIW